MARDFQMKNIKIEKIFSIQDGSFIYTDFFESTSEKVALVFKTTERGLIAEQAITLLLQTFQENFYKGNYKPLEKSSQFGDYIKERLKKTVIEMHWRLAAFFNRENHKFEISTIILIIKNDIIYVVQSGRIMVMTYSGKSKRTNLNKVEYIGLDINKLYEESHQLPIMGIREEELRIKVYTKEIQKDIKVVILPIFSSSKFNTNIKTNSEFKNLISKLIKSNTKPLLIINITDDLHKSKRKKKFRITTKNSALTMIIVILVAGMYVFFGRRWMQGIFTSGKELIDESKRTLIDYTVLLPRIPIPKLEENWKWTAPATITGAPIFDFDNIYLIMGKELLCIRKNDRHIRWSQICSYTIADIKLLREEKILLVDEHGIQYLIKKVKGDFLWKGEAIIKIPKKNRQTPKIIYIDYIDDGRLQENYYVAIDENTMMIISGEKGNTIAQKDFNQKIDFISEYDYIEKCFYLVFGKKILKVNLLLS